MISSRCRFEEREAIISLARPRGRNRSSPSASPGSSLLPGSAILSFLGKTASFLRTLSFEATRCCQGARYYDAALGQFLSEDPIGFEAGDSNLRRYVGNGPTGARDPSGLEGLYYKVTNAGEVTLLNPAREVNETAPVERAIKGFSFNGPKRLVTGALESLL